MPPKPIIRSALLKLPDTIWFLVWIIVSINPGVGGMGYHYINVALLDTVIDPLKPEAMVYDLRANGTLELGAVEYIVPAAGWDAMHSQPPTLFGQVFGLEQALGVYELHAWIWKHNPYRVFCEWNPKVSCSLDADHFHR